ncbi:MAG TPA: hypothetical protein VM938_07980 [Acidimicrobiales bacterium]|nr:hypothetical protein [Acidimicrobiales bacterium]
MSDDRNIDEADDLDLVPDALKDLTVPGEDDVRGGAATPGRNCECGTA